ncbi:hypothetical protein Peur_001339 [Populus x canadensis]
MDHGPLNFPVEINGKIQHLTCWHMVLKETRCWKPFMPITLLFSMEKMKVMKPSSSSVDSVTFAAVKICCCSVHKFMDKQKV